VDATLERARELKQALIDFVYDADGDLAQALESYAAAQLARSQSQDIQQQERAIDFFVTEGKVGEKTPIELFIANRSDLSKADRALIQSWQRSFIGLFEVKEILPDGFDLMNWLTAKHYTVKINQSQAEEMKRFKLGEILLTRISPVTEDEWMFSGPYTAMGNLGKPKLAVAIGNFKDNYKPYLYSDAPEMLEEAWKSVERYHQDFLDFFGSDEITMPGYQLQKKIAEFQQILSKKQMAEAGIDDSKSLAELAEEAGVDEAELEEAAEALGADAKMMKQAIQSKQAINKMVTPQIELPPELKKAEHVTVIAHPRWGQMFLPTYTQFKQMLEAEDLQNVKNADKLVQKYLDDSSINAFVWHRLANEHSKQLEQVLQTVLDRSDFKLDRDLDPLLQEHNKPLEPELPEIASVPIHLHNLFQDALAEVSKSKPKAKDSKKKLAKGFQRA
jgi:hypothetical protein